MGHDAEESSSDLLDELAPLVPAVEQLAQTARRYDLARLRVSLGDLKVEIEIGKGGKSNAQPASQTAPLPEQSIPEDTGLSEFIFAPMIGTFYSAAAPGDPPFIEVGEFVEVGQVVAIIEAMKIMNEIAAETRGTIAELLVKNGQAVEYGQPLYRLVPGDGSSE